MALNLTNLHRWLTKQLGPDKMGLCYRKLNCYYYIIHTVIWFYWAEINGYVYIQLLMHQ